MIFCFFLEVHVLLVFPSFTALTVGSLRDVVVNLCRSYPDINRGYSIGIRESFIIQLERSLGMDGNYDRIRS